MNYRIVLLLAVMTLACDSFFAADIKLQDPTKPPISAMPRIGKKQQIQLRLSEIRIANHQRQAVINGQRLIKGNRIAGYRVKKIEVGYVILANEKETLRLNLISSHLIRKKL